MALTLLAANNAQTVLAAGISASATSLTVNSGTGSLFPAPSDGVSFFKLTLIDAATGQLTEIMHVTARTGDTMTIERGQEGTTARAWSANDIAANMMTAGTLNYILANFQPLDATLTALAWLATGADKLPYFTGENTAAQTDLTPVGRDIIGKATTADVLTYLGLGEGAPAIGVPFFWPSAAMPNTVIDSWSSMVFLKFNGARFSATDYPVLAKVFPSLVLPEARGDFIRIWDDGRGVDGGRTLLSAQGFAQQRITGGFMGGAMGGSGSIKAGALVNSYLNYGASSQDLRHFSIDSAIETKTASETRPRNIAFNFLVRAK